MSTPRRLLRATRLVPSLLRRAVVKAWGDRILGLSAEAAFWQLLSLPSLFLALIASLGYVSRWFGAGTVQRTELQLESTLSRAFSEQVVQQVIRPTLREVLYGDRADIISIAFVLALWAGSSATATFVNTIAIAYDMRDLRGPVRSRLLALWIFLATVLLGVFLLPMLVLGPDLLRRAFPHSVRDTVSTLIDAGYYPVLVLLLLLGLTTFYKLAPPRRLPWRRGLPGATLAVLVFLAGSAGLRAYITFILDHNHAYGTLAAPIAALLFFFVLALGVLLGAEFNAAIEERKPARVRPPRVLDPRNWQVFSPSSGAASSDPADDPHGSPPGAAASPEAGPDDGADPTPARDGAPTDPRKTGSRPDAVPDPAPTRSPAGSDRQKGTRPGAGPDPVPTRSPAGSDRHKGTRPGAVPDPAPTRSPAGSDPRTAGRPGREAGRAAREERPAVRWRRAVAARRGGD